MNRLQKMTAACFAVAAVLFCAASIQAAPITMQKDSADFGIYQYEMTLNPSGQDLDGNTTTDFFEGGGSAGTFSGGILSLDNTSRFYESSGGGANPRAWPNLGPTATTQASGYTIEARLRVNSEASGGNADGATTLASGLGTVGLNNIADALLNIGDDTVTWGTVSGTDDTRVFLQNGVDNTDDFHIFRIAMGGGQAAGSEVFSVWRDGELLSSTLTDTFLSLALNRMDFGDLGGRVAGDVDYDYVRFTAGAFAPVATPEPGTLTLFVLCGLGVVVVSLGRRLLRR